MIEVTRTKGKRKKREWRC